VFVAIGSPSYSDSNVGLVVLLETQDAYGTSGADRKVKTGHDMENIDLV